MTDCNMANLLWAAVLLAKAGRGSSAEDLAVAACGLDPSGFEARAIQAAGDGDSLVTWLGIAGLSGALAADAARAPVGAIWEAFVRGGHSRKRLVDPDFLKIRLAVIAATIETGASPDPQIDLSYILSMSLPQDATGYAHRSHELAGALTRLGIRTKCFTRPGFPWVRGLQDVPGDSVVDGIAYHRTGDATFRQPRSIEDFLRCEEALVQALLADRPKVVMSASNYATALPALLAARRAGLPFIYEVRGFWELSRASRDVAYQAGDAFKRETALETAIMSAADLVYTLNSPMKAELGLRGIAASKVGVLPNSANPARLRVMPPDQGVKARLGIPADVPVIGYIGSFTVYEGLDDLILACGALARQGIDFRLVIAGWDPRGENRIGPALPDLAKAAGISDRLILLGHVPRGEVPALYSILDIAPVPRKNLAVTRLVTPLKVIEAMAMGKAVVVSDLPPLREIVGLEEFGCSFPGGDPDALADALAKLCRDPALRGRFGRAARARVESAYAWPENVAAFWKDVSARLHLAADLPVRGA